MPSNTETLRQQLLDWIEEDQDALVAFSSGFVAQASPNPPGDTRDATGYLSD
jgi:succinyl-diaminopimelate desuccinylase